MSGLCPETSRGDSRKASRRLEVWCRVKQAPSNANAALQALLDQEGVPVLVRFFSQAPPESYGLPAHGQRTSVAWTWESCPDAIDDATLWLQQLNELGSDTCVAWANDIDVPTPYRLHQTMKALELAEMVHGSQTPLLVHSDAFLCSLEGVLLQSSWWKHQRASLPPKDLLKWMVEPGVLAASMMVNPALAALLRSCPQECSWEQWVAAVATCTGQVISLHEPLIFWCEQPGRVPSGRPLGERLFMGLPCSWREGLVRWRRAANRARALLEHDVLGPQAELLKTLGQWEQLSRLQRAAVLWRWRSQFLRSRWGWAQLLWSLLLDRNHMSCRVLTPRGTVLLGR
jgi:hypothetical protein